MSTTLVSSGLFRVRAGETERFLERWADLISWTREHHPGMTVATLHRSDSDLQQFVSFATWATAGDRDSWRASPGYRVRSEGCRELCDEYIAGDYHAVLAFGDEATDGR